MCNEETMKATNVYDEGTARVGRTRSVRLMAGRALTMALATILAFSTVGASPASAQVSTSIIGGNTINGARLINLSTTGYTGSRDFFGHQTCSYVPGGRVQSASFLPQPAAAYARYSQVVQLHTRLDKWDGTKWVPQLWATQPQGISLPAGIVSQKFFATVGFTIPSRGYYAVVQVYTWYVGTTLIGQTWDTINGEGVVSSGGAGRSWGDGQGYCVF